MHTLRTVDRDRSMTNLVSFHGVPMPRMIAFAIRDIERNGAPVVVASADRTVAAIAEHNAQFGTRLHAQQFLFDHQGEPGFNPANPPSRTSHCYKADATIAALLSRWGVPTVAGGPIPRWALGVDLDDVGKHEDVTKFMSVAHRLGYVFAQPYSSGSERHHVILVQSPIRPLERRNQISHVRHA